MLGRILRSADFERVLSMPVYAKSAHFAIHFLDGRPGQRVGGRGGVGARQQAVSKQLSTDAAPVFAQSVDESRAPTSLASLAGVPQSWLGTVVPKRHAKRAVTRTLLKRQMRAALLRRDTAGCSPLESGLWVLRLRAPFDRAAYPSARSDALREAARGELDAVVEQAARRLAEMPRLRRAPTRSAP